MFIAIFLSIHIVKRNKRTLKIMSKEKETDAATVLSQMSQLVCVTSSFDFSSSQDSILDEDAIGATCTLQPSTLGI